MSRPGAVGLTYPAADEPVTRELLTRLDELNPCSEHWKILITAGMGFFAEFGPNTTTFVYPAEIFPVRVRTTSHGIRRTSGKLGAFAGTYALTALLPVIGFARTSAIVAGVCVLGLLVTVTLLPEPKGLSLEEPTEPGSGQPARLLHPVRPC